jgi:hypothetical protein
MGIIGILKKNYEKNGFFLFFSSKNLEIVQFHLGHIFCSAKFRQDSPIFPKNTGLGLIIYIIATGGQLLCRKILS